MRGRSSVGSEHRSSKPRVASSSLADRAKLLWIRMRYRFFATARPRYAVRYRGIVSAPEWTFSEALKMARAIPPKTGAVEILLPGGVVHFTCPSPPIPPDLRATDQK